MKKLRKSFRKIILLQFIGIVLAYFTVTGIYDLVMDNRLTDAVSAYSLHDDAIRTGEDLDYRITSDGGMLEVEKLWMKDGKIFFTLKGTGRGYLYLTICKAETGASLVTEYYKISRTGRVTNVYTGNYSNWQFHLLVNVISLTLFVAATLIHLLRFRRKLLYSYEQMFAGGLLIWLTSTVIIQWYAFFRYNYVFEYYISIQQSAYQFMLYTIPVVWPFCIALTISNFSLIRHEGYRPRNALGIFISAMLIFSSLLGIFAQNILYGETQTQIHVMSIILSSYCSVYSLLACLLEGAILGGIAAAKHTPAYDKDYIIILGCMIRKDGSLTPLLKGRVDRALMHAERQERMSGKKAVFVPSGGQGRNEVMAEAEAMKNYLLSQGIPEERILLENKSKNTAENMRFSKKLIEEQHPEAKIAFSTTNFHVFRSGIIATQNDFCPEGMGSRTKWYFWPNAFIREFIGMLSYTKFTVAGLLVLLIAVFAMIEMMTLT